MKVSYDRESVTTQVINIARVNRFNEIMKNLITSVGINT